MTWFLLAVTVALEAAGVTCMKLSKGFRHLVPTVLVFVFYTGAFSMLTIIIQTIPLGIAYGVWSGAGTAATAIIGFFVFKESINKIGFLGIGLVCVGIFCLKVGSLV